MAFLSYTALIPPINFGLVRAQTTCASPIAFVGIRTGTATSFKCIPIKVSPISIPAQALMCSTAAGCAKALYAAVAKEPPAFGCGTTFTIS